MIKFPLQFVSIKNFGAITSRRYFFEELLARWKRQVFLQTNFGRFHMYFFTVKACTQLLRNFFEICSGMSNIMCSVDSLLFSFAKMIQTRSQKRTAVAIVINSYTSSAANCMRRL